MTSISSKNIFFVVFILTIVSGLIVQLILPSFAPAAFSHGLLLSLKDPMKFHNLAVDMAARMTAEGFRAFEIAPHHQFPAGPLGFFYYVFSPSPLWQLPLNGIFTALTGVLMFQILRLFNVSPKFALGFILISLFTPSSMTWVPQISKDIYLIFAVLCLFRAFFGAVVENKVLLLLWILPGALLIFLVKDHWIEIFLAASIAILPLLLLARELRQKAVFFFILVNVLVFFGFRLLSTPYHATPPTSTSGTARAGRPVEATGPIVKTFEYESKLGFLDKGFHRLSYTRYKFLLNYAGGKETYMPDYEIKSSWDAIAYTPLALSLGMLEPFPWRMRWDQGIKKGALFTALQLEMILVYIALGVLLFSLTRLNNPDRVIILSSVLFCMVCIFVLAYVAPNTGAINRYRFPFLLVIKLIALGFYQKLRAPKPAVS